MQLETKENKQYYSESVVVSLQYVEKNCKSMVRYNIVLIIVDI